MTAHTFSGRLRRWGRLIGVEIPADVSVAMGIGGHAAVAGRVNGVEFRATLVPLPGARHRLLFNADTRGDASIAEGDAVEIVMSTDPSGRVPPVPDDFAEALEVVSARERFEALPAAKRREHLLWIADAIEPATRSRRVARAVARVVSDV